MGSGGYCRREPALIDTVLAQSVATSTPISADTQVGVTERVELPAPINIEVRLTNAPRITEPQLQSLQPMHSAETNSRRRASYYHGA